MDAEVLGIDHVYLSVRALAASEAFYDVFLLRVLGFRKNHFALNGEPHVQYYNRQFGFVIRPAREGAPAHDPGTPGLHHFCFRVRDERAVDAVAAALGEGGIAATAPRYYAQYADDYYATFLVDPDGVRLEVTNFRANRRARMYAWDEAPEPSASDPASRITGSCLCGAVRYEADGPPGPMGHCHCGTCRKAHGAAFSTIVPVPKPGFRWTAGEGLLAYFESSPGSAGGAAGAALSWSARGPSRTRFSSVRAASTTACSDRPPRTAGSSRCPRGIGSRTTSRSSPAASPARRRRTRSGPALDVRARGRLRADRRDDHVQRPLRSRRAPFRVLGFEVTGPAALATSPLHWALFATAAWAFWTGRPWIVPWAAGYLFYVALSHLVWSEASPHGRGWPIGLAEAAAITALATALLWLGAPRRRSVA
jgi:catechol 2,3-dioxygenase-like lactoylglutathione lyase family enzyme